MQLNAFVFFAAVIGLCAFGLVSGFALAEATCLFVAILVTSTLWLLSSWGERAGHGEV